MSSFHFNTFSSNTAANWFTFFRVASGDTAIWWLFRQTCAWWKKECNFKIWNILVDLPAWRGWALQYGVVHSYAHSFALVKLHLLYKYYQCCSQDQRDWHWQLWQRPSIIGEQCWPTHQLAGGMRIKLKCIIWFRKTSHIPMPDLLIGISLCLVIMLYQNRILHRKKSSFLLFPHFRRSVW